MKAYNDHNSNSLESCKSLAICGSATVKMPDPQTFSKLTPATVMIMAADLRLDNSFCGGPGGLACTESGLVLCTVVAG
jgi:hypothetical protein